MTDAITTIDLPGIKKVKSGKVRELFEVDDHYLMVATDRISAFDCIMPNGIPQKGAILTQLSNWWFNNLSHIVPHHIVAAKTADYPDALQPFSDVLNQRSVLVKKTRVIPIECVARGYLIGSGWKEYRECGRICNIELRPGYQLAERLDEPIFTPASKADSGHDENISFQQVADQVGIDTAIHLRDLTLRLYGEAAMRAHRRGIILADTKFEFGITEEDNVILIDEALTPDSSRYWPTPSYQTGISPPSFDKQFVRDYLESLDWDKTPPAPELPEDVVQKTRDKYLEVYQLLTGKPLEA